MKNTSYYTRIKTDIIIIKNNFIIFLLITLEITLIEMLLTQV